ncbi:flavin reductase family protein [Mycobacterium colombiense]|uniref:flavin reductase family protein n=1 Tax=Mycobacterium colombiense TaxID=339268 RepID=UPI0027E2699E|nr:flavin reductase family protein [Mycobacterium colombiense]
MSSGPVTDVEPRTLRDCLGRFATGVTILTYDADGAARGVTVNAFSAVSLDPPLILVAVGRKAKAAAFLERGPFCVNVLHAGQVDIARTFAGRPCNADIEWTNGALAPRLARSHAWLECTPWRTYDGGDHLLFLGEVKALSFNDSDPLLFHCGDFHWRGDALDDMGRSRRLSARPAAPLHQAAVECLTAECIAGWS